jgi:hypothetical protein
MRVYFIYWYWVRITLIVAILMVLLLSPNVAAQDRRIYFFYFFTVFGGRLGAILYFLQISIQ